MRYRSGLASKGFQSGVGSTKVKTFDVSNLIIFGICLFVIVILWSTNESQSQLEQNYFRDPTLKVKSICEEEIDLTTSKGFFSQYNQDLVLIELFADEPSGRFVDLAAAWPQSLSNTFYLEACLGWNGICIDADVQKVADLRKLRKCKVIHSCVTEKEEELIFRSNINVGSNSFIKEVQGENDHVMTCQNLDTLLPKDDHFDFMSLDIEGNEFGALMGYTRRTQVDVLLIELSRCCRKFNSHPEKKRHVDKIIEWLTKRKFVPIIGFPYADFCDKSLQLRKKTVRDAFYDPLFDHSKYRWQAQDVLFIRKTSKYYKKAQNLFKTHCPE